jgi:uncharacterized repeat protein (TIGR01451 family)
MQALVSPTPVTISEGRPNPAQDDASRQLLASLRKARARQDSLQRMTPDQKAALGRLTKRVGAEVDVRVRPGVGTPRFLEIPSSAKRSKAVVVNSTPLVQALSFLSDYRELLLLQDPAQELRLLRQQTDELQRTHLRFSQQYQGLEVWPAEMIVHVDPSGEVDLLDGAFVPTPKTVSLSPTLSADAAAAAARNAVPGAANAETGPADLIVYAPGDTPARLAWRVQVDLAVDARWLAVIDAENGATLNAFNQVMNGNVAGSGVDLLNVTRTLNVWQQGTTHYLVDASKQMFDPSSTPPSNPKGTIVVLDANHQTLPDSGSMQCSHITSSSSTSGWLKDGVSAAFGISKTYDYYLAWHGRNSLDGAGGNMMGIVRYGQNYANAFWNGQAMFFGDAMPFAGALDVLAHELTHGVVTHTANLIYQNQSGAMNEAFADIFGDMVQGWTKGTNDWQMGEDLGKVGRSLSDPSSIQITTGRYYPAKMSQFIGPNDPILAGLPNQDNGGVHLNSTIIGHAHFMLSAGLTNPLHVTNSARIFYRALTTHLVTQSQFLDCRLACISAAKELFGATSAEAQKTAEAFDAVEIFDGTGQTPQDPNPTVTNVDSALFVYYDFSWGGWYLARREDAQGDPAYGTPLSDYTVRNSRPSVSGDGGFGVFVSSINDLCFIPTDGSSGESSLGYAGQIASAAMAPDGHHYAFVFQNWYGERENRICYVDTTGAGSTRTITLTAPSDAGPVSSIAYADTLCFTPDNRYIVYDALNSLQVSGGMTNAVWSIYAYDLQTERILTLVAPTPGLDVGNPSMGHIGNNLITFEACDQVSGLSKVIAANLQLGTNRIVGTVDTTSGILAWPCYNGDDSAIVYSQVDSATQTGGSLTHQALAADHVTPTGSASKWVEDGACGFVYRRGTYVAPAAAVQADLQSTVAGAPNPVSLGSNITFTVTVSNTGPGDATGVTLVNTLPANCVFVTGTMSQGDGEHLNGKVTCNFGDIAKDASVTATIIARTTAAGAAQFTASVASAEEDPNPANNNAATTVTVGSSSETAVLTLVASPANGGSVSGGGTFPVGSQQQISATANSGWSFTHWQDANTQNPRTVTVPSGGATYTAYFTTNQTSCDAVTITAPIVPAGGATGHVCTLQPSSAIGYVTNRATLPDWIARAVLRDSKGNNITMGTGVSVTLSAAAAYTISFDVTANTLATPRSADVFTVSYAGCQQYLTLSQSGTQASANLVVQASPAEGGTVSGGGTYAVGTDRVITAVPNLGWVFGQWHDGNTQNPRTVTMPASGAKYTAYFTNQTPQIATQPQDVTVGVGQNATFSVQAAAHTGAPYVFYWYKQGALAAQNTAATASDFTVANVQLADAGEYRVVVSNAVAGGSANSRIATLTVTNPPAAPALWFSNTTSVVINDASKASLYPSTITLSGLAGTVVKATVTLHGLTHPWPQDVGALLVGPQGQKILLMANAGGGNAISGVELTFDDAAATALDDATPITSRECKPGFSPTGETFFTPAPAPPYGTALSALAGADPNGVWSLYLQDDQPGDSGSLAGGWTLALVLNSPVNPNTPTLGAPSRLPNGQFQFTLSGAAGSNYEIRATSDLVNWKILRTITMGATASNILDASTNLTLRFYRAKLAP